MPYILPQDRERLDPTITELAKLISTDQRAGDLNYTITKLLLLNKGEGRYKDWNELVGALESCKLELYRKHIAPYEDEKIKENGDVE
ncbi:hypothetical protein C0581_05030 [Candidatus Parcubacteria bacterium]|nr:MAG: hypothetical protein C0581_05030 [Candidatus Parcubacteria bacterium]